MVSAGYITPPVNKLYKGAIAVIPGAVGSGVLAAKSGFHSSRNYNRAYHPYDYSLRGSYNDGGPGDAAAAIDITMSRNQMVRVTRMLMDAIKAKDPRVRAVKEVIGTVDNKNVVRYTRDTPYSNPVWASSDSSHLWHVHLSIFRDFTNDEGALMGILEVLGGKSAGTTTTGTTLGGIVYGLSKGDSGNAVELLQTALHSAGFSPGDIDGDYGPATADAVLRMRKSQGSGASDGNNMTAWAVVQLERALAVKAVGNGGAHTHDEYAPKHHEHPEYENADSLPSFGDTGRNVQYWQRVLNEVGYGVPLTAEYDSATRDAVKAWFKKVSGGQEWHGNHISSWIGLHLQKEALASKVELGTLKISGTVTAETE